MNRLIHLANEISTLERQAAGEVDGWVSRGWELLEGSAFAKVKRLLGGEEMHYAKKFGRKTVFLRDSGVFRLRSIGPEGEVYQLKEFSPSRVEQGAKDIARAAMTGVQGKGMYVVQPR